MSLFSDLRPAAVWDFFEQITRIPRPSKHEEQMADYLVGFAKQRGLEYRLDKTGNVLIVKPATRSGAPTVVLQSHMDMVCEKHSDVDFDFLKEAIRVKIDGDWVCAGGTTLGADDGIGIAATLAILDDRSLKTGRIEALFTVDEETGLSGAFGLEADMLTGNYLINLDSEDEGEIFIGCAGGVDTLATFRASREALPHGSSVFRVAVSGLKGGHSGDNINDGLANANKLLTRLLWLATDRLDMRLSAIDGGNLRNAIPREAWAVAGVQTSHAAAFQRLFDEVAAECKAEFAQTEPTMRFALDRADASHVIDRKTQQGLLGAMQGAANGVLRMSRSMSGLVETSSNLASVKMNRDGHIVVVTSQRSSVEGAKWDAARTIGAVFRLAGAEVEHSDGYPGWAPDPSSGLLRLTEETYLKLFGRKPNVRAIHAGLECGLFREKYPHLEMVSFGPTLRGVHSPDERMEIASVGKFWKLLVGVLENLK